MKTLVYFASGPNIDEYQFLPFDRIYLIDKIFRNTKYRKTHKTSRGKIICIGMDCLDSIECLNDDGVRIDYFVSLNEGLYEGGGRYAINSDMFLGYVMPLLKDDYIHIMNKKYYHNAYNVSMDIPYLMEEVQENDSRYLSPLIFSKNDYHKENAKVYKMTKNISSKEINIASDITINIVHDSIWNHYEELEMVVLSLLPQGQGDFFAKIPKVKNIHRTKFSKLLEYCVANKVSRIGFTPWMNGDYQWVIDKLRNYMADYPNEISFYHLNKNDYKELKAYAAI